MALTLAIDCGGSGIKGSVVSPQGELVAKKIRIETTYPFTPTKLLETIETIAGQMPKADRITVGLPGMVRQGVVITSAPYITSAGRFTAIDPEAQAAWTRCPLQEMVSERFGLPALVMNDADVQGFGVIKGKGLEFVITLGSGFGTAYYLDGQVGLHLEMSQMQFRKDTNFDQYVGEDALLAIGKNRWTGRVLRTIDAWREVFMWDHCYLGGGNTKHLVDPVPSDVTIVPNVAGIIGGARAWELLKK